MIECIPAHDRDMVGRIEERRFFMSRWVEGGITIVHHPF
jgi:hypothetical protein